MCVCENSEMHAQKKFPLSSEWDKEAWRVRRNEETLNFKKGDRRIELGYTLLTRVFRLSILSLGKSAGKACGCALFGMKFKCYMYRIGIVFIWHC